MTLLNKIESTSSQLARATARDVWESITKETEADMYPAVEKIIQNAIGAGIKIGTTIKQTPLCPYCESHDTCTINLATHYARECNDCHARSPKQDSMQAADTIWQPDTTQPTHNLSVRQGPCRNPNPESLYVVLTFMESGKSIGKILRGADANWQSSEITAHIELPFQLSDLDIKRYYETNELPSLPEFHAQNACMV